MWLTAATKRYIIQTCLAHSFSKITLNSYFATFPVLTPWDEQAKLRLEGVYKLMSVATPDLLRLTKLHATLDVTDQRRGTDWKSLFPEINEYFKTNRISNVV